MPMYWWVAVHVIGAVLGVGAATMNDVLFMRALGRPEEGEAYRRYGKTISQVAWLGVALLVISAIAFWRIHPEILHSQKIMFKIGLTLLLVFNAQAMLSLLVPYIAKMQPADWKDAKKLTWVGRVGVPYGVVSAVSWYTALILGAVGRQPWTALQILPFYVAAIAIGYIVGRIMVAKRLAELK